MGHVIMTAEGGNSEIGAHEHLIEMNERLTEEVKNLKQLAVEQNERLTEEVKNLKWLVAEQNERCTEEVRNLKQSVAELYLAFTMRHAPPPMPSNLSGFAPTIVHQAHGLPTTDEDPQYSPNSPYYYNASKVAGSSTMCPLAPPPPLAPPSASVPQFTVLARSESLRNETEKERDPGKWNKREFKQPHSYSRTPQKHHQYHYSPHNPNYSADPLQKVQPYAPASSYSQWRTPVPQTTYNTPHHHFQAQPSLPSRKRKSLCSRPGACHKKLRRGGLFRFTPIGESYTRLFEKLQQANLLKPISGNMNPTGKVDRSRRCTFHSGAPGHDIEDCWDLKKAIEAMIDNNQIKVVGDETQDMNQNPLPVHDVQNDTCMVETVFTEEDLKESGAKQILEANPSPDIRRHESSTVVSVGSPNASVPNIEMQDGVVPTISHLTRSFISSKECKSTLIGVQANEAEQKTLSGLEHIDGTNMIQYDAGNESAGAYYIGPDVKMNN